MRTNYIYGLWINQNSAVMEEWRNLMVNTRGVFRIQSNIHIGAVLQK